jgi:hypothetical protein
VIDVHWVILGAALSLAGSAAYIRDTLRGTTHPNRVTWLLWGVAPMIAFAAELREGVGLQSLMTFMIGFGPLLVLGASFLNRNAVWHISRLDWVCGALSVAGTVVWLATRQGLVAITASIAADGLAAVPTVVKSWRAPHTETSYAFLGGLANASITLLTITRWTAAESAFPIYIACMDAMELTLVAGRLGPRFRGDRPVDPEREASAAEAPPAGDGAGAGDGTPVATGTVGPPP